MSKYKFTNNSIEGYFDCRNCVIQLDDQRLFLNKHFKGCVRRLYLIFSKKCNLKCVYCFQEGNAKNACQFDSESMMSLIKNSIDDFDEIVLYGGEPLLSENLDIIGEIFSYKLGIPMFIFTNGNISSAAKKMLVENKDQINGIIITLDGTKEIHDVLRVNPNASSFDNALSTLKYLGSENILVQVQINVDIRNHQDTNNLIEFLKQSVSCPLHIMLNPIKYTPYKLRQEQLLKLYFETKKEHPNTDIQINSRLSRNLFSLFGGELLERERCNLSKTVVANFSNGEIYACPHNEESRIGYISDKLIYDHSNILNLLKNTNYSVEECNNCEYNYLCSYGCPFESNEFDICKESMDNSLKMIFDNFEELFDIET